MGKNRNWRVLPGFGKSAWYQQFVLYVRRFGPQDIRTIRLWAKLLCCDAKQKVSQQSEMQEVKKPAEAGVGMVGGGIIPYPVLSD